MIETESLASSDDYNTEHYIEHNNSLLLYQDEIDSKNKEKLKELDNLVLLNKYDNVYNAIMQGNTLFVKNKLCNGLYNFRFGKHPKLCKKSVCNRTSLYYALRNNCRSYITIYLLLVELRDEIPELRQICECCDIKINDKYKELSIAVNSIIYGLWKLKCECEDKYNFQRLYLDKYLNFSQVTELLCIHMPTIIESLDKIFNLENLTTLPQIQLHKFTFCIHEHMKTFILQKEHLMEQFSMDMDKIKDIIVKLKAHNEWYNESLRICTLLFNQQSLETFSFHAFSKCIDSTVIQLIPTIYDNRWVDVDYYTEQCPTALNICVEYGLEKSASKLIELGAKTITPQIFFCSLRNGYYSTCYSCIEILGLEKIITYDTNLGHMLIMDSQMDIVLKNNFLCKIFEIGFIPSNDILNIAIQMSDHGTIVKTLLTKLSPSLHNAHTAVQKKRVSVLTMLLEAKLAVNAETKEHSPLIFACIENIEMLNILLKYNCDVNVKNKKGLTPIWEASVHGRLDAIQLLLDHNADFMVKDNLGNSCVMVGIQNEQYITPLIEKKDKSDSYIINYENAVGYTALILAVYSKNALKFIKTLSKCAYINFNYFDKNSMNIIDHVIENTKLSLNNKIKIFDYILDKIDFTIKPPNGKPFLVRAIENNEYEIAKYLLNYLIKKNNIELLFNSQPIKSLEKSFRFNTIKVVIRMKYEIDIYTIVYNYLKQIFLSGKFKTISEDINWYIVSTLNALMLYTTVLLNTYKQKLDIKTKIE